MEQSALNKIIDEINAVLTSKSVSPDPEDSTQLLDVIDTRILDILTFYNRTAKDVMVSADKFLINDSESDPQWGIKTVDFSIINNAILLIKLASTHAIIDTYTILNGDGYTNIDAAHSASTKLINVNLPSAANNENRIIDIQNTGMGLTYINGDSTNLVFKGTNYSVLKLIDRGDRISVRSNGAYWIVEKYNVTFVTGWIGHSDGTAIKIGNGVTYSNKSSAVNLTGQKFTESTSGITFLCIYDSGGTASSGILYFVNITGAGVLTNGRTLTSGQGRTPLRLMDLRKR